jgi:lipooligosaccharide transport system permease protein
MLVAMLFGLNPSWGMFLVPFFGALAGFGWANFGIAVAARMKSIDNFSYVISAVLTPLFLVAGTFFPITTLPEWAQVVAQINPLHHLVELVRDAVFGLRGWADLLHLGVLAAFALLTWRLAVRWMQRRLIDGRG